MEMNIPPKISTVWRMFIKALESHGFGFEIEGDIETFKLELYDQFLDTYMINGIDAKSFIEVYIEEEILSQPGQARDNTTESQPSDK